MRNFAKAVAAVVVLCVSACGGAVEAGEGNEGAVAVDASPAVVACFAPCEPTGAACSVNGEPGLEFGCVTPPKWLDTPAEPCRDEGSGLVCCASFSCPAERP